VTRAAPFDKSPIGSVQRKRRNFGPRQSAAFRPKRYSEGRPRSAAALAPTVIRS
jgi:hypothetical protein